jgi:ATP-dependent DNA helicase RecG
MAPAATHSRSKHSLAHLDVILKDALTFFKNAVIQERVVKHGERPEADHFFNVPYAALEEAVVNAVYHRSYEIREPIEVRVLPDKITVASCQQ